MCKLVVSYRSLVTMSGVEVYAPRHGAKKMLWQKRVALCLIIMSCMYLNGSLLSY